MRDRDLAETQEPSSLNVRSQSNYSGNNTAPNLQRIDSASNQMTVSDPLYNKSPSFPNSDVPEVPKFIDQPRNSGAKPNDPDYNMSIHSVEEPA